MSKYTVENTVGELLEDKRVVKLGKEYFPELFDNPYAGFFYGYRLSDLRPLAKQYGAEKRFEEFIEKLLLIE
ncbi:MAG TPA: hypothetical protein PK675_03875 [Clostridia bacterium]|nr:hypothetical protein [Clostridia bacterium]